MTTIDTPVHNVSIYLKGWRDGALYADAVNRPAHPLHAEAWKVHAGSFMAYQPGDVMFRAIDYSLGTEGLTDAQICEEAFKMFNVGDPVRNITVRRYRNARNRSLSVGDVVVIDGRAYACARFGWDRIDNFDPVIAEH
jgi:hypothetical protein